MNVTSMGPDNPLKVRNNMLLINGDIDCHGNGVSGQVDGDRKKEIPDYSRDNHSDQELKSPVMASSSALLGHRLLYSPKVGISSASKSFSVEGELGPNDGATSVNGTGEKGGSCSMNQIVETDQTRCCAAPNSATLWLGWNYLLMCTAFAVTQGCASATISLGVAYADELGSTSAGITFACHTLSSLLLAAGVTQKVGPKNTLVLGSTLMSLYVISYFSLQLKSNPLRRAFILSGSLLGGLGTGFIWTAQGVYMTMTVHRHAHVNDLEPTKISGWASGMFAAIALGGEVIIKAVCTPIDIGAPVYLFLVLGGACTLSTLCLALIERHQGISDRSSMPRPSPQSWKRVITTLNLLRDDTRILFLAPFNVSFGMTLAFLNFYIIGKLAKQTFGATNVGLIAALKPASASVLSVPYSFLISRVGKKRMLVFAACNYLTVGLLCLLLPQQVLASRGLVVVMCVIAGSGRSLFEGANKGLLSDMFRENVEGAFGNVMFQSGFGATTGFFIYPHMSKTVVAAVLSGVALMGLFGILKSLEVGHCASSTDERDYVEVLVQDRDDEDSTSRMYEDALEVQDDYFDRGEVGRRVRANSIGLRDFNMDQ